MLPRLMIFVISILLVSCDARDANDNAQNSSSSLTLAASQVDAARIINADATPGEWLSHGRTYSEQRFSPLKKMDDENVENLGLAWYADLPTRRGVEATPLMADGKLYVTGSWGHVLAFDARTGENLWHFDPKVPKVYAMHTCCDAVNRGVALWGKNVYVGSLDGRIIAQTWNGQWWKHGKGGGTAWDSFAFDPDLNLFYIGVGNGASWNQKIRNPQGGDNLFLSSIVAVDAEQVNMSGTIKLRPGTTGITPLPRA